jgi:hypothetical protein
MRVRPPVSLSSTGSLWEGPGGRVFLPLAPMAALLLVLASPRALGWPVDLVLPLEPGKERFHKLSVVDWVEVEDPSIATAEVLAGSNELLLTGVKPGRTLLLLYAEGKLAVWRLVVGTPARLPEPPPSAEPLAIARKACPGLRATEGAGRTLVAPVRDSRCRDALLALLKTDVYLARELELTFELPVLREQLAALTAALQGTGLTVSYHGAGLVLAGTSTPEGYRRALWVLFRQSVGRVSLEDRTLVQRPAPDAGTHPLP